MAKLITTALFELRIRDCMVFLVSLGILQTLAYYLSPPDLPPPRFLDVKHVDGKNGNVSYKKVPYYSSHDGGFTCFEGNERRETITVEIENARYARDNLFKRVMGVSVNVKHTYDGVIADAQVVAEGTQIEKASCIYQPSWALTSDTTKYFTSYRFIED